MHKDQPDKNWLTSIPDRLAYAWDAPEQRFEWLHLTRRRFFRNLCNMPGELAGWAITTKERGHKALLPDFSGNTSYKTAGQWIDSSLFTGILFKQVLDIGAKFGLSAFVKTAVSGYNRNEEYKSLLETSATLRNLAVHTIRADAGLTEWAQELASRDESPLVRLSRHTEQAGQIMMEFCQGTLLPTDRNLSRLQTQMDAMAQLCDQKAGITSAGSACAGSGHPAQTILETHAPQTAANLAYSGGARPSDHIREVLLAPKLTTAKQAVTYLTTVSGLVADGATEISSEVFTHKDEHYLSAQEATLVTTALKQFTSNHPAGVDVIALANQIKSSLRDVEKRIEPLLSYADIHFAQIDRQFLQPAEKTADSIASSFTAAPLVQSHQTLDSTYYQPRKVGLEYVVREESKHEMMKLYSRSLPTYLYQAPINLIERLILPNTKGKWEFNKRVVGSELKAASWMALYNPAAESFGGVSSYEATRLDLHTAVEAGKRLDAFMAAAVATVQTADTLFAQKMRSLTSNQSYQQLIDEHRELLAKPADKRSTADYAAMGQLMHRLSDQAKVAQKECCTLLTGNSNDANLKQHMQNIFMHGAKNTADALFVLTLARFLEHAAEGQILSYEYTHPHGNPLDKDRLKQISAQVLAAAQEAGFAISSETLGGQRIGEAEQIAAGMLVKRGDDGVFRVANQQELVGFANQLVQALTSDKGVSLQKFMTTAEGRMSDKLLRDAEQAILEQFQPTRTNRPLQNTSPALSAALSPALKAHPKHAANWRETIHYITRPEAVHEMHQLRDRYLAVSLFGFPVKIITNILRGDFDKISTAFGKWSLASTGFAAIANTLAPSYGAVALKEAVSVGNISLKHDCTQANEHLQHAIHALGNTSPQMKERLIASLGVNPLLANKQAIEGLAMAGNNDAALNRTATSFIDHAATALIGKQQALFPASINHPAEIFTHIMRLPVGDPAYAALKLAALDALVSHERYYIDMLRYEGTSARLLENKKLKAIVDHIEDRFYTEGTKLDTASPAYLTALADELAAFALPAIQEIGIAKPTEHQPTSDRIKRSISASVAKGLN